MCTVWILPGAAGIVYLYMARHRRGDHRHLDRRRFADEKEKMPELQSKGQKEG